MGNVFEESGKMREERATSASVEVSQRNRPELYQRHCDLGAKVRGGRQEHAGELDFGHGRVGRLAEAQEGCIFEERWGKHIFKNTISRRETVRTN